DFETKNSYSVVIQTSDGSATYSKTFTITVDNVNEAPTAINFVANQGIITSDLILHLDASNPNSYSGSGTSWNDLSGNGYDVNLFSGVSYQNTTESIEKYFDFDGSNDYAAIENLNYSSGFSLTELSVFAWVKTTYNNGILNVWDSNNWSIVDFDRSEQFNLSIAGKGQVAMSGRPGNNGGIGNSYFDIVGTQTVNDGNWHHIGYTYSVSNQKIVFYVDGQIDKTYAANGNLNGLGASRRYGFIGDGSEAGGYNGSKNDVFYDGSIATIELYHTALSPEEIAQNFSASVGSSSAGSTLVTNSVSIEENKTIGSLIIKLAVTDVDVNDAHNFSLVNGAGDIGRDNDSVTVSGTQLLVNGTIDFESTPFLLVNIQVTDGSNSLTSSFTINVTDLNDTAPTAIGLSTTTFAEDITNGSVVATLSATDIDTASLNSFSYSLVSGDGNNDASNGSFTISGTTLMTNETFDYETAASHAIYLQVNDGVNTFNQAFSLNVSDQNDTPTDISLSQTVFFEGIVSGSTLATITTTDQDTADTHTFTLVSSGDAQDDDNASFTVSGTSLITNDTLDFETKSTYALYLEVNDGTSQYTEAFSLTVSDTNDTAPTTIGLSTTTFAEDIASGSVVATLSATDIDTASLNSFSYSLVSGDGINDASNSKFIISGNTLVTSGTFDYETAASHAIYLQVNDGANTFNQAFTLSITDLNEVPTDISLSSGSSVTFSNVTSINDNEALNAIIGTLQTTDEDQNDTYTYALVNGNGTNDSDNTLFTLNGNQLVLNTNLDYKLQTSVNINMQVSDGTNFFIKSFSFAIIDKTGPRLSALSIADDNRTIAVQFDEAAFSTPSAVGSLTALDFNVSSTGGTASLTSNIPNSVTFDGTQYILGLTIQGATTGDETVLVNVAPNAVFDALGNAASGLQNNTITLHGDADSDGVLDSIDICPDSPLGETADVNGCAESQKDPDNDGVSGSSDNCPNTYNPDQADNDNDGIGDQCDPDDDNDGVLDTVDNCQFVANPNQEDVDTDGIGDVCDLDNDNDGIEDTVEIALGLDPLDTDNDDDGINDADEIALGLDPLSSDSDNDGIDDAQDVFPLDVTEWIDTDNDGIGNNSDTDDDNDGVLDTDDVFPYNQEEWFDNDGDGLGDNADLDDDNDTFLDEEDAFPLDATEWIDTDNDGIGNHTDTDDDGDGYLDTVEVECLADPLDANSLPDDFDLDFIPDCLDEDDDNDGFLDPEDDFPFDPKEWFDSDGDGLGDNIDPDDDNDTI
ncbi:thrombospondin type 3 repeat-containing protein, partial [Flavobacteriaceae bacterium]|nr:thrombospondin type 3 repeat-containing protein [Flavobacteriaceae bacterium]